MSILEIFSALQELAEKHNYSDIHLNTGNYPIVRDNNWDIKEVKTITNVDWEIDISILGQIDVIEIIKHILGESGYEKYLSEMQVDSSYGKERGVRYRINCYKDSNWDSIAMRSIPHEIPTLESLWLWKQIQEMCSQSKGLVLVTGPTGSWKSTNLAAMIDYINTNYKKHIITIEDPIEFVFKNKLSLINQREVGMHTSSFASAIKWSLREDPDIIMIWEMRDPETIKAAITLAETGHLVFSTLHTNDAVQTVDRIIDVFPAGQQDQIRMQLAMSLVWVIAQRLVPRMDKAERIATREILMSNDAVRNLIISAKSHQLYSVIEIGQKQWMVLMDNYLIALYKKWFISKETLLSYVRDKENVEILN